MKKWIALGVVSLLVFVVAMGLSGCGGDTKQAKEYMQKGDDLIQTLQSDTSDWQNDLTALLGNIADPAKYQADVENVKSSADDLSNTAEEAKAEFEKIMDLSGVDDYKKYAELEIKATDTFQEIIDGTSAYLDELNNLASSNDLTAITNLTTKFGDEAQKLGNEVSELDEKAQKLKEEKGL